MAPKSCVIGGSGFLGGAIAQQLAGHGHRVTVVDLVAPPEDDLPIDFVRGSVNDLELLLDVTKGCDAVFNCAAVADIETAGLNPIDCLNINVNGVITSFEASAKNKIRRYVLASSLYVGGKRGGFYRISKSCAEDVVKEMSQRTGMSFTIARYGSLYGPSAQSWNGVRRMVEEALRSGRLVYRGSPAARREYIHITDAARLSTDLLGENFKNKTVLISGTESYQARDVLNLIAEILELNTPLEFIDEPSHHRYTMTPYTASIEATRKLVPTEFIEFGQGILQVVAEIQGLDDGAL